MCNSSRKVGQCRICTLDQLCSPVGYREMPDPVCHAGLADASPLSAAGSYSVRLSVSHSVRPVWNSI